MISVRSLLSDCNTARLVANRPRVDQHAYKVPSSPSITDENSAKRDEAAAEVLSVGYFTTLQILFLILLFSPGLAAVLTVLGFADVESFFVAQMLKDMRAGTRAMAPEGSVFKNAVNDDLQQFADSLVADQMAGTRAFGIADVILRQLLPGCSPDQK